jgi:WD40 repeat protein
MSVIKSVQVTQRGERMAVAVPDGFAVFTLDPWSLVAHVTIEGRSVDTVAAFPRATVAVFCTHPKTITVYDWSKNATLLEFDAPEPVMRILAVARMFALISAGGVLLYTYNPPNRCFTFKCLSNHFGPADFAEQEGKFLLAMAGHDIGALQLFVVGLRDKPLIDLEAANHPLSMVRFNQTGTIMATASARGTLIRLFDTKKGGTVGEFRRGSFQADICSISFSPDSRKVAVLSNKGTVHIFDSGDIDIDEPDPQRAVLMWRMPEFEPAVVEFLSKDRFGLIKLGTGVMDLFKVDSYSLAIVPDGSIAIVDVK